jgi:hypothetical protein
MQHHNFGKLSDMVSFAGYQPDDRTLYLTYHSGPTTIAYRNISPEIYEELVRSAYPDVCIRFKIQARHAFRRVNPAHRSFRYNFVK